MLSSKRERAPISKRMRAPLLAFISTWLVISTAATSVARGVDGAQHARPASRSAATGAARDTSAAQAATESAPKSRRIVVSTPLGPDLSTGIESEMSYRSGVLALLSEDPLTAATEFERSLAARPDRSGAHALLGASLLLAGSTKAISALPLATKSFLSDFEAQSRALFNLTLAACAGLALLFAGALLAPIVRALPTVFHEISESLPAGLPSGMRRVYPIAILAAPLLVLKPWVWVAGLFWFLALFLFLSRRQLSRGDRVLAMAAVLCLAALPSVAGFLGTLAAAHTPRSPAFSLARSRDPFLRDYTGEALRTAYAVGADDPAIVFELALHERRHGSVQEAADLYERLLDDGKNRAAAAGARVNLGNILYARGEVREAAERYEQALELMPNSAAAHYNLAVALTDAFDFGSAKTHFRSASALNFDFVRSLSRATDDGDNIIVVDEATPARDRWRWLFANQSVVRQIDAPQAARVLGALLFPATSIAVALLVLLFVAAFFAGRLGTRAEPCAACGAPVCRKCRSRISRRSFCAGCAEIVSAKGSVSVISDEKKKRFRAAHTFHRVASLVLAIFVPGSGHVYIGKHVLGCALLFLSGAVLFLLATGGGPLHPVPALDGELIATMRPSLVLVLVNLHIAFLIHFFALARRKFS